MCFVKRFRACPLGRLETSRLFCAHLNWGSVPEHSEQCPIVFTRSLCHASVGKVVVNRVPFRSALLFPNLTIILTHLSSSQVLLALDTKGRMGLALSWCRLRAARLSDLTLFPTNAMRSRCFWPAGTPGGDWQGRSVGCDALPMDCLLLLLRRRCQHRFLLFEHASAFIVEVPPSLFFWSAGA